LLINLVGYVRRHHLALVALFFALGGSAYAATTLPPASVGTKQIRDHAVTLAKISTAARSGLRGRQGPQGARGLQGPQGAQGLQGVQGNTGSQGAPGPTASASNTISPNANSIPGSDTPQISTTITTSFASRIVVNASLSLTKSAGTGDVVCQPQIAPSSSSTFTSFSEPMYAADPLVTSNYYTVMPVTGAVAEPAGSYQIQIVCHTGAPTWSLVDAAITAVATAQ
jgi:hypothetical protein